MRRGVRQGLGLDGAKEPDDQPERDASGEAGPKPCPKVVFVSASAFMLEQARLPLPDWVA